ncbi:LysR family transcriptional regulator [Frigidibacter sp. ROC022]|uniref:LysR family transcriptional regulator n=1 Tax=Frigidibacter sp. ROC022 TaxID=2971796 RepID=UPI00215A3886|nr:LysR family transcriptional regulator [Frigidibacter sp. ROC022]MCR8725821.1 LysR family transcriptional regulator [Frigidibacter sp. ROC022]
MDLKLVRTFLEVSRTGSFVAAADRLFLTQSAVSLRIRRLEDDLGQPLFHRSKAGAELTHAGREFEHYALSLLNVWEAARQQVALPEGFTKSLSIGGQYSLWPRLGFRLVDGLREAMPNLNIRTELGLPERLTRLLGEGVVQMALIYTPHLRPGLVAHPVMQEELVLVAAWPDPTLDVAGRYVFVDWGPEFLRFHSQVLPDLTNPGLTFRLGAMAVDYIVRRNYAAYLPARYVKRHIDAGQLHLVPEAPRFPYPVWSVWRDDLEPDVAEITQFELNRVVATLEDETQEVLDRLDDLSNGNGLAGAGPDPDLT